MSMKKKFTLEEIRHLRANPYTLKVSEETISYTLAFKEAFWALSLQCCTGIAAFRKPGYNTRVLIFERIHNTIKGIRKEAKSLEGLHEDAHGGVRLPSKEAGQELRLHDKPERQPWTVLESGLRPSGRHWRRKNILTVQELCELAGVSRSGYYNWVNSEQAREMREQKNRPILNGFWRHTNFAAVRRAPGVSTCGACTWVCG